MKKRTVFLLCGGLAVLLLAGAALGPPVIGTRPLKDLTAEDIQSVEARIFPCGAAGPELTLTQEEMIQLVPLLNQVVVHQRDNSWGEYDGGSETFFITMTDGSRLEIMNYGNLFFIVNGESRRADYSGLSSLCDFVRRLRD